MYTDLSKVCSIIEQEKSTFKIVTKTKNESFFIEKWIIHHLNIVQNARLIIFDNMSDDEYVHSIYKKYKDNIILIRFDGYMDCLHMANKFMQLYKSLQNSSKFFTIIDSDEYLYFYNDNKIINDNSILQFLDENVDCNFFAPCWIRNISDNENIFYFDPKDLSLFHQGKPIINTKIIPYFELALIKYECPILHHTQKLPILTYGKTKTKFILLHMKNLNKYQRIKSNMQKLSSFNAIKHDKDFSTLIKINPCEFQGNIYNYIIETKNLVDKILCDNKSSEQLNKTIEICNGGILQFRPESYEQDFKDLMNSDYFDLVHFASDKVDIYRHTTIQSCFGPQCPA